MHILRTVIQGVCIKRIFRKSRIPIETQPGANIWRRWLNALIITREFIVTIEVSILGGAVAKARILKVGSNVKPIASNQVLPVERSNASPFPGVGRARPVSVVLHSAVHIERALVIDGDLVKLGDRNGLRKIPTVPVIVSDSETSVASNNKVLGVVFIDPHSVKIGVNALSFVGRNHRGFIKTYPAVVRHRERLINIVETIGISRVYC